MEEKKKGYVEHVRLMGPVFQGEGFDPTYINFFFGKNGSGKSTIAKEIGPYKLGRQNSQLVDESHEWLIYNEDFITENVQSYANIPGVFTITKEDAEAKKELDDANLEKKKVTEDLNLNLVAFQGAKSRLEVTQNGLVTNVWKTTADIRSEFPETQTGFRSDKKKFCQKIKSVAAEDCDIEEIRKLYGAAFKGETKNYRLYNFPQSAELPDTSILKKQIIPSASTAFADFIKALNNLSWVEHGHAQYTEGAHGKCPYCQQSLPKSFEADLASCYDEAYQKDMEELQKLLSDYRASLNTIYGILNKNREIEFEAPQVDSYRAKLDLLLEVGNYNISQIREKIENPAQEVSLKDVDSILGELCTLAQEINEAIKKNNDTFGDIEKAKKKCVASVWGKMAYDCEKLLAEFGGREKEELEQVEMGQKAISERQAYLQKCEDRIASLNSRTTNTAFVMESINRMLQAGGFQGFRLCEKPNAKYVYQLVREDGSVARGLSEGERHIISFLYFYHLVIGSQSDNGGRKDKIVIIDDPVSSMDSNSMALVAQLIRNMVSICYNNYSLPNDPSAEYYIKQFFCLTHNPYFFKEITYNRVADYECVSLFEIRKGAGNHSTVIPCTKEKRVPGGGMENYSPVKNYYDGLWHDYKETDDPVTLYTAMRGILEYYFLQMCGYPGNELRTALLNIEQTGEVDKNDYDLAYSLLSTLDAGRGRLDVGVDFDSSALNLEQARRVFELIFRLMRQEQHYKLMMGEK